MNTFGIAWKLNTPENLTYEETPNIVGSSIGGE